MIVITNPKQKNHEVIKLLSVTSTFTYKKKYFCDQCPLILIISNCHGFDPVVTNDCGLSDGGGGSRSPGLLDVLDAGDEARGI